MAPAAARRSTSFVSRWTWSEESFDTPPICEMAWERIPIAAVAFVALSLSIWAWMALDVLACSRSIFVIAALMPACAASRSLRSLTFSARSSMTARPTTASSAIDFDLLGSRGLVALAFANLVGNLGELAAGLGQLPPEAGGHP